MNLLITWLIDLNQLTNELGTQSIVSSNRQLLKSAFEGKKLALGEQQTLTSLIRSRQKRQSNLFKDFADQLNMAPKTN